MKKTLLLPLVVLATLTMSTSCSDSDILLKTRRHSAGMLTTPIGEILENPQNFADGTVSIKGVVSNPKGLGSRSVFTLSDRSGEILVYCKHFMAPAAGETIKVQGTVCMPLRYNDHKFVYIKQTQTKNQH